MSAFSAVLFWKLVRAVGLGYGGTWFFPAVVAEAVNASLAFLVLGVADAAMRRWGRLPPATTRTMIRAVEYVALVAYFGKGWLEPHTSIAEALQIDSGLNASLVAIGLAIGLLAGRIERLRGAGVGNALVWWFAGWLICGPEIYARWDSVLESRRLSAVLLITVAFAVPAIGSAMALRRVAPSRISRATALLVGAAAAVALLVPGVEARGNGRSVVLIVVDTLRADAIDRRTASGELLMPRLHELANQGVRFDAAIAPAPWTLPSTATILNGQNPFRHRIGRVLEFGGLPLAGPAGSDFFGAHLRDAGYQVAGFVNNPYLRPFYGFGRGFLRFRRYHGTAADGRALAGSWIVRHRARPRVVLLHIMDPHWPYEAPAGYGEPRNPCDACDDLAELQYTLTGVEVRTEVRRRYDAETAFADAEIGRLYDDLVDHEAVDDSWIIITADHGEEFWEHFHFLHGHSLYDELLRVPLIVVPPPRMRQALEGRRVAAQVRLEDIVPTVMDLLELPLPSGVVLDGASLAPWLDASAGSEAPPHPVVAGFLQQGDFREYAVRAGGRKLIAASDGDGVELYELRNDPRETKNVAAAAPEEVSILAAMPAALGLQTTLEAPAAMAVTGKMDADLRRELERLGYVD